MKTREIAELVAGELIGDAQIDINSIAPLREASDGQLAFCETSDGELGFASCVLVPRSFSHGVSNTIIRVDNPKLAFAKAATRVIPYRPHYPGSRDIPNPTAIIADSAEVRTVDIGRFVTIGDNSYVAEGCEIGDGTRIGRNVLIKKHTIIHQNCVIYDDVEIGDSCVIHAGTVIGADGFGYVRDEAGQYHQFPQIGTVVIEDNVEIGANTCIDRGALGETRVGAGTKIDNLVQIAHNVSIGKRVVIAAQTGISGSTVIEDDCVIGGQVGMGDHATVKSGAIIGSQAGVLPGKIVRAGVWWGTPVQPLDEYKRQNAMVKGLVRLRDEVKELKRRLGK